MTMRTYAGFLLLEDLFDLLPTSNLDVTQFANSVFNPTVLVTETDCGTTLGKFIDVNTTAEGFTELAKDGLLSTPGDALINRSRVEYLLGNGIYTIAIRDLHACTSIKRDNNNYPVLDSNGRQIPGICQKCYAGTFPNNPIPAVGTLTKVNSRYISGIDSYISSGASPSFPTSRTTDLYNGTEVFIDGIQQSPSTYSVTDQSLTLSASPSLGTNITLRYVNYSAKPYLGYLAETYSGGLLGMNPLATATTTLRPSLIKSVISDGQLDVMHDLVSQYHAISSSYLDFSDTIVDKLEKALFLIALYGVFSDVIL